MSYADLSCSSALYCYLADLGLLQQEVTHAGAIEGALMFPHRFSDSGEPHVDPK